MLESDPFLLECFRFWYTIQSIKPVIPCLMHVVNNSSLNSKSKVKKSEALFVINLAQCALSRRRDSAIYLKECQTLKKYVLNVLNIT